MAACLLKAAQNLYCTLPYVECLPEQPVRTCFELWIDAMITNVQTIHKFITVTLLFTFAFVRDRCLDVYCTLPVVACETEISPVSETIPFWVTVRNVLVRNFIARILIWLYQSTFFNMLVLLFVLSFGTIKIYKIALTKLPRISDASKNQT